MNMRNLPQTLLVLFAALFVFAGCSATQNAPAAGADNKNEAKLLVYTSFYPMYDFAAKWAGS